MEYDLSKYTYAWFDDASLYELEEEREYVRSEVYCNPDAGYIIRCQTEKLLDLFDNYIRKKKYGDSNKWYPPKSTIHGWYLPNDD